MKDSKISISTVVVIALLVAASALEGRAAHIFWAIVIGLIVVFVGAVILILKLGLKPDDGTRIGNYVYFDYDNEPGIWAHNDALYAFKITRTDNVALTEVLNTDEGWEIESYSETDPEGSCGEHKERAEVLKNGLSFHYNMNNWQDCWWFMRYDMVRLLFDKNYFNKFLKQAEQGDAVSQTLIGCCYGHNGKMSQGVVKHDINTAVFWWKKAAEQGFPYAMRELAIFHWHKHEKEEAFKWNELSGNLCWVISRFHHTAIVDVQREQEENKESATDSKVR